MWDRILRLIVERPALFVASVLMLALPFARHAYEVPFNNRIDFYFEKDDVNLKEYRDFSAKFRSYESIAAVFAFDDLFTNEALDLVRKVSFAVKGMEKVAHVSSLTSTNTVRQVGEEIRFEPLVPKGEQFSPERMAAMKREILSNSQVLGKLVSQDGRHAMLIIEVLPTETNRDRDELFARIKTRIHEIAKGSPVKRIAFAGLPLGEGAVERAVAKDNAKFQWIIPIMVSVVVLLTVKNLLLAGVLVFNVLLTSGWVLGTMFHLKEPLNPVTVVINPTLIATGIAEGIHIVTHLLHLLRTRRGPRQEILVRAMKDMWFPCFMTSMTSVVGYLSFLSADIRPIKMVGVFMAMGLVLAYFLSVFLIPALLSLFYRRSLSEPVAARGSTGESTGGSQDQGESEAEHLEENSVFERLCAWNLRHSRWTGAAAILGIAAIFYGISMVRIETNFESYIPEESDERKDLDYITQNVGFLLPFELMISLPEGPKTFADPRILARLSAFQNKITQHFAPKHISSTWSYADYVALLNQNLAGRTGLPATEDQVSELLELGDSQTLDRVLTPDHRTARMTLFAQFTTSRDKEMLVDYVQGLVKRDYAQDFAVAITGMSMLYHWLGERIFSTQISSFSTAFVPIFIMMVALGGGLRLGFISMIPNIIPILGMFGLMGWLRIPLETSTVMIASIVLGIAVDDTIHFLHWYRTLRLEGYNKHDAICRTFGHCGRASLFTSTIVSLGFVVLVLSDVTPLRYFGMLTALSMVIGVASEFVLLPLSLYYFDSAQPHRESFAKPLLKTAIAMVKGESIKKDKDGQAAG